MKNLLGVILILEVFVVNTWAKKVVVWDSKEKCVIGTYTTIQEGITICPPSGTVTVYSGTYTEAIYINKGISLIGIGRPTIDPPDGEDAVTFFGTPTNKALISGFIIKGAVKHQRNNKIFDDNFDDDREYFDDKGIYCSNGNPTIKNNTISGYKYGIYCYDSSSTIINNTISENKWGIYCSYSSPTITNNTISVKDISGDYICGIYCENSSPTITNNTISGNNISGNDIYGIYCYYSSPTIINNTISGYESGIDCKTSSPTITNNTISGNKYGISRGYDIFGDSSSPTIINNIITQNSSCGIYNYGGGQIIINYNCIFGNGRNYYNCLPGPNDIQLDPKFIGELDYHLKPSSPCIDRGTNQAPGLPSTDKDGNPRIIGGIVDIGAYEFQGQGAK